MHARGRGRPSRAKGRALRRRPRPRSDPRAVTWKPVQRRVLVVDSPDTRTVRGIRRGHVRLEAADAWVLAEVVKQQTRHQRILTRHRTKPSPMNRPIQFRAVQRRRPSTPVCAFVDHDAVGVVPPVEAHGLRSHRTDRRTFLWHAATVVAALASLAPWIIGAILVVGATLSVAQLILKLRRMGRPHHARLLTLVRGHRRPSLRGTPRGSSAVRPKRRCRSPLHPDTAASASQSAGLPLVSLAAVGPTKCLLRAPASCRWPPSVRCTTERQWSRAHRD